LPPVYEENEPALGIDVPVGDKRNKENMQNPKNSKPPVRRSCRGRIVAVPIPPRMTVSSVGQQ
jgi:hypothetical protein